MKAGAWAMSILNIPLRPASSSVKDTEDSQGILVEEKEEKERRREGEKEGRRKGEMNK